MLLKKDGRGVVGIMGVGVVGGAVRHHFERLGYELRLYDPQRTIGSEAEINEAELIFVCVPTPYTPSKGFDGSAVEQAVSILDGVKSVVIKSTVLPGTTEAFQLRYPQHAFLFNPEFLRHNEARTDFAGPDRQIVGYTAQSRHLADALLAILPLAPLARTLPAREAELAKYMANSFLALKVTFANELFDLAIALDSDYDRVREIVGADPRIGPSHLDVFDSGYRGYDGNCLGKDTKSIVDLAGSLGVPLHLLRVADEINAILRPTEGERSPSQLPLPSGRRLETLTDDRNADGRAA